MDYSNNTHYKHSLNKQNQSNPLIFIKKPEKTLQRFCPFAKSSADENISLNKITPYRGDWRPL